jgi:hypothetical protein
MGLEITRNFPWLEEFKLIHGRMPRVLHIGNIANNAYNNAKILNECGLENDVICYDYYHVMGTPEWEDADFIVSKIDQFQPNWSAIDLNRFERPKWYAQGPINLCINYLLYKNAGNKKEQLNTWADLCIFNQAGSDKKTFKLLNKFKNYTFKVTKTFLTINQRVLANKVDIFINVLKPSSTKFYLYFSYLLVAIPLFFLMKIFIHILSIIFGNKKLEIRKEVNFIQLIEKIRHANLMSIPYCLSNQDELRRDLVQSIDIRNLSRWRDLFSNYDIVIGYSTDGIYPLVANVPYIAFEHGTIREIPYQNTPQGRLCSVTYSLANHVFVTNFDCKQSAEFLAPNRHSLINHPFDENHSHGIVGAHSLRMKLLQELDCDFLFFFPTRHDWVDGTGYADKANDVFLNAFVRLRQLGFRVGAVCCEWGQNVESSKKILSDSNVDNYVKWSEPMATVQFERTAMASDCVVDQFKLGSFGGILFKAMAAGSPVITFLNKELLKEQFSEMPPVINCKNETDIINSIKSFYENPESKELLGQKSRDWINRHHSKRDTINKQLEQFKILLQHKLVRNANDSQRSNI